MLDKLTYAGNLDSWPTWPAPALRVRAGRHRRPRRCAALFGEHQPTAVVNFAAETHVDRSIDGPRFVRTNVVRAPSSCSRRRGSTCARTRTPRRSASSTSRPTRSTARSAPDGLFAETTPYAPNSPYSASKAAADHFVRAYHGTYGLPVLVTNCSNNYGPYQFPEKLIPLMILNALEGEPAGLRRRPQRPRLALRRGPLRRHAAGAAAGPARGKVQHRRRQRADQPRGGRRALRGARGGAAGARQPGARRARARGLRRPEAFVADRPGHDRRYAIDARRRRELGWRPGTTSRAGCARPCAGTSAAAPGARRCRLESTGGSAWAWPSWRRPGRRRDRASRASQQKHR